MASADIIPPSAGLRVATIATLAYLLAEVALASLAMVDNIMLSQLSPEDHLADTVATWSGSYMLVLNALTLAYIAAFIAAHVLNAVFLYRAGAVALALSTNPARPTAHGAWAWHLVPIASLFMPYVRMRQIHTFAIEGDETLRAKGPPWLLHLWLAWLAMQIGTTLSASMLFQAQTVKEVMQAQAYDPVICLITTGTGLLFLRYMREVAGALDVRLAADAGARA